MSYSIAIIGGTGAQGKGLAARFAVAGHSVVLGSRDAGRAAEAAAELTALVGSPVSGATNEDAARSAAVVVVATPWDDSATSHAFLAPLTEGKVVISCVNPLGFDKQGPFGLSVAAGSAAQHLAAQLPNAKIAGAFHHVAAGRLLELETSLADEDVLVAADDEEALRVTCEIASAVSGRAGVDVGPLRMCAQLEPWTAVLISINKNYRCHSGIAVRNVDLSRARRPAAAQVG